MASLFSWLIGATAVGCDFSGDFGLGFSSHGSILGAWMGFASCAWMVSLELTCGEAGWFGQREVSCWCAFSVFDLYLPMLT